MAGFDSLSYVSGPTLRLPYRLHGSIHPIGHVPRASEPKYATSLLLFHSFHIPNSNERSIHRLNLLENAETNLITAMFELPGLTKQEVQLSIQGNTLILSAENKTPSEHEEGHYLIHERQSGKLRRSLPLPKGITVSCLQPPTLLKCKPTRLRMVC
jgi:hypothetical protein